MTACRKFLPFVVSAALLGACGRGPATPTPPAAESPPPGVPAARAEAHPRHVLLLRHAEKPDAADDKHLSSRGSARAAALPSLFHIPKAFRTTPAPFPTPDFLFAAAESKNSNRSAETVKPLAKALGDAAVNARYADDEYRAAADLLFGDPRYAGKVVLVCWHHGKIPELARAVLAKARDGGAAAGRVPKNWAPAVFDRVWQITFDDQGGAAFQDRPQRLLYNDRDE